MPALAEAVMQPASAPVSAAMVALARACNSCMRTKWPIEPAVAADGPEKKNALPA